MAAMSVKYKQSSLIAWWPYFRQEGIREPRENDSIRRPTVPRDRIYPVGYLVMLKPCRLRALSFEDDDRLSRTADSRYSLLL
jgi:hypothetical protein